MPIKKHVLQAEAYVKPGNNKPEYVFVRIPETLCSSLGIGGGTPLKLYSDKNNYSFTVEVPLSFKNVDMLQRTLERNEDLKKENKELQFKNQELYDSVEMLKRRVFELENNL